MRIAVVSEVVYSCVFGCLPLEAGNLAASMTPVAILDASRPGIRASESVPEPIRLAGRLGIRAAPRTPEVSLEADKLGILVVGRASVLPSSAQLKVNWLTLASIAACEARMLDTVDLRSVLVETSLTNSRSLSAGVGKSLKSGNLLSAILVLHVYDYRFTVYSAISSN